MTAARGGTVGRRWILVVLAVVALIAAVMGVWAYRSSHRAPSGCDTVRALMSYNAGFNEQMRSSADSDKARAVTPEQYREWANRLKDYASDISDPDLSGNAETAADAAGRLADLVPRYRAKPDDPATTREYASLGIEFGNAINRLEYSCLPTG